jgi:replicative DNA helicase
MTLRNHIEKLLLKGFTPDVIMIDYADIMRSSRKFDSLRHELKLIYEELRNLAMEMKLPIWTASQANRDSANSEVVGLENMSEAYGKAMVADVVLSLSRKAAEKSVGVGRVFVAKNRAGRDGILYPMRIDTSMSRFTLIENAEEMSLSDAMDSDASDMRSLLKKKWKEINDK